MSVSGSANCYLVPIYREPSKYPIKTPSLIGRWHSFLTLTGDGSGGYYLYTFLFSDVRGIFGVHSMFNIQFISTFGPFGGTLVAPFATLYLDTGERTANGTVAYNHTLSMSILGIYLNQMSGFQPTPLFRFSDVASPTQFVFSVSPNTNLQAWSACLGGEIHDERML